MGVGQSVEPLNTATVRPKWVQILNNLKVLLTLQTEKLLLQWTKVLLSSRLNEYNVVCLAIFSCIHPSIHPHTHPFILPTMPFNPSVYPSIRQFTHTSISTTNCVLSPIYHHPIIYLSSPQPICSFICSVIHTSFHSPVYLVIQQCIYFTRC